MFKILRITILSLSIIQFSACDKANESETHQANDTQVTAGESSGNKSAEPNNAAAEINKICALTMGWESWEPYHYQYKNKPVKGLDIEMMEMITKETGCEISFKKGEWKALLQELKEGEIDLLTGASISNLRKEFALFSDGYRTESFRLYVRSGEAVKFSGYNMKALIAEGFRLGITMDYIYNDEIHTLQDNPENDDKIIPVSTGLINISKLFEGEIDGFLEDPIVGSSSIRRQGLESQIELHPYVINTGDVHVMFSKASVDDDTVDSFNRALATIRTDGRHQHLMDKYSH